MEIWMESRRSRRLPLSNSAERLSGDQRAVGEDAVAHTIGNNPIHQLKEIGAAESLSTSQAYPHHPQVTQGLEKTQPLGVVRSLREVISSA